MAQIDILRLVQSITYFRKHAQGEYDEVVDEKSFQKPELAFLLSTNV